MIGKCDKCKQEKKIVQRVFLNEGDEEPVSKYCKDCFDEIAPYRIIPDESTVYGIDCRSGKCEM